MNFCHIFKAKNNVKPLYIIQDHKDSKEKNLLECKTQEAVENDPQKELSVLYASAESRFDAASFILLENATLYSLVYQAIDQLQFLLRRSFFS